MGGRRVRVTDRQAAALARHLHRGQGAADSAGGNPPDSAGGIRAGGAACAAGSGWTARPGGSPGVSVHTLAHAIACRGCGRPTHELRQRFEGVRVGDPVCPACDAAGRVVGKGGQKTRGTQGRTPA